MPGQPPKVVDGQVIVQATLDAAADSVAAEDTIETLRASLDRVGSDVLVGGTTATNLDVRLASERDLKVIIPTILAVIFVVLMLLLRSIVAPLVLVAANVLSFAATMGVSAHRLQPRLRLPGVRPVDAALRLRLPRRAGHRLLDLPHDARPRGVAAPGAPGPASSSVSPSRVVSSRARASFSHRPSRPSRCCRSSSSCRSPSSSPSASCSTPSSSAACSSRPSPTTSATASGGPSACPGPAVTSRAPSAVVDVRARLDDVAAREAGAYP